MKTTYYLQAIYKISSKLMYTYIVPTSVRLQTPRLKQIAFIFPSVILAQFNSSTKLTYL